MKTLKREPRPADVRSPCHLCKKSGDYLITMHPLKDDPARDEPYIKCKPMQFKITRNHDDLIDSSSDSELDIEFTAPAAIARKPRKKPQVGHIDCQYDPSDFDGKSKKTARKTSKIDRQIKKINKISARC
ncbi:unnamed protein product [Phyllotreta striolata]|uniref:DUF4776 domain-containing protein n=1 Tax=Phyllotreta striolata TaxID=444603 RepID=A0A9N9XRF9_PHYSR|nr:unnamed protein product [Phyllotreta striolata]